MFDTSKNIRTIIKKEPLFGEFLKEKGFPLNLNSPITLVVSFDDVSKRKKLNQKAFLVEYAAWKENQKICESV